MNCAYPACDASHPHAYTLGARASRSPSRSSRRAAPLRFRAPDARSSATARCASSRSTRRRSPSWSRGRRTDCDHVELWNTDHEGHLALRQARRLHQPREHRHRDLGGRRERQSRPLGSLHGRQHPRLAADDGDDDPEDAEAAAVRRAGRRPAVAVRDRRLDGRPRDPVRGRQGGRPPRRERRCRLQGHRFRQGSCA